MSGHGTDSLAIYETIRMFSVCTMYVRNKSKLIRIDHSVERQSFVQKMRSLTLSQRCPSQFAHQWQSRALTRSSQHRVQVHYLWKRRSSDSRRMRDGALVRDEWDRGDCSGEM